MCRIVTVSRPGNLLGGHIRASPKQSAAMLPNPTKSPAFLETSPAPYGESLGARYFRDPWKGEKQAITCIHDLATVQEVHFPSLISQDSGGRLCDYLACPRPAVSGGKTTHHRPWSLPHAMQTVIESRGAGHQPKLLPIPANRYQSRPGGYIRSQSQAITDARSQSQTICGNVPQLAPDLTKSPALPENKACDV